MKIWTSYFGNVKKLYQKFPDMIFMSIAGKTPESKTVKIGKLLEVAPKYSWWKEWHEKFSDDLESEESKKWYTEKYKAQLSLINLKNLADFLELFSSDICLLCYETPEKFCHRHILASMLSEYTKFPVEEIKINKGT